MANAVTWFRVDDTFATHPKAVAAGNAALGLWVRAGSWSGQQLTEGYIPKGVVRALGARPADARKLVDAGLWTEVEGGYRFHEWEQANPTRAEVEQQRESNRRRQALVRSPEVRDLVRRRDHDLCRYCGVKVRWNDRRSSLGGTYDHVDPRGTNDASNLVVACKACNTRKRDRTPEEAGMPLLNSGSVPRYNLGTDLGPDLGTNLGSAAPPARPVLPTEVLPTGRDAASGPDARSPQTLVAEWIDHCGQRPPGKVVGQISKLLEEMLTEGIPYGDVRAGLVAWQFKGLHPAALPSVVHETRTHTTPQSTTDSRIAQAQALKTQLRNHTNPLQIGTP